jgi:signal transduction histidine kinase
MPKTNEEQAAWAVVVAIEDERRRWRREIHDQMSPMLAALRLRCDRARDGLGDGAGVLDPVDDAIDGVARAMSDLLAILDGAVPAELQALGLAGALRNLGESLCVTGLETLTEADVPAGLPPAHQAAIYKIFAEALTDIVEHTPSRRATASIERKGEAVVVEISGSGRGSVHGCHPSYGIGLVSMRERAAELGGKCSVYLTDAGTIVRAWLPLGCS